jgi:CBS domain-containing protein
MRPLLVRDAMTIGVPVCRDSEICGVVLARLTVEAVVALDDDGMACGWLTRAQLAEHPAELISEVMDEDIPTTSPTASLEAAAQTMRARGVTHLFLIHDWPGEPRPSAVISLHAIEERMARA